MQQPPEQQQYPQTNVNVTPDGVIVNLQLGPNIQITTGLSNEMLDEIYSKSKEVRKEARKNLEIVRNMDVVRSINGSRNK